MTVKKLTARNKNTTLEHRVDKLHGEIRSAIGFALKVCEFCPLSENIAEIQDDARYLVEHLKSVLEEYESED